MPLPLVPFLIVGASAVAGAVGVKKGYDAKCDFDDAKDINSEAQNIYAKAEEKLNSEREATQQSLEFLGRIKYTILNDSIIPFIDTFSQIKNIDNTIKVDGKETVLPSKEEIKKMEDYSFNWKESFGGGVTALGSGGLAGLAAYGSAGTLATASTGTAIGGLSGAAATNATLAWFGGGSLATGGLGMAGGTAVLGGLVAAPIIAVGGMMLASKAEAAKEDAITNLKAAELAEEEMNLASTKVKGIRLKVEELSDILSELQKRFINNLDFIQSLVKKETNFKKYSKDEIEKVYIAFSLYETLSNLLEVQLLNEEGSLTKEVKESVKINRSILLDRYEKFESNDILAIAKNSLENRIDNSYKDIEGMFDVIINKKSNRIEEKYKGRLLISYDNNFNRIFGGNNPPYLTTKELSFDGVKIDLEDIYYIDIENAKTLQINQYTLSLNASKDEHIKLDQTEFKIVSLMIQIVKDINKAIDN